MKNRSRHSKSDEVEEIRCGSFVARLNSTSRIVAGRSYVRHRLTYYEPGGRRISKDFSDLGKARKAAEEASQAYAKGRPDALSFSPAERAEYDACVKALDGTPYTLFEAVSGFLEAQRNATQFEVRTVEEVVAELVADRKAASVSGYHLKDLGGRLGKFAQAFNCPIGTVTPAMIEGYLAGLTTSDGTPQTARSKRNVLRVIQSLFHFARRRSYVHRDRVDAVSGIRPPKVAPTETGIFTPDEMERLLRAANPKIIPALAIGGFAGVRIEEIQRLDWSDVRLTESVIVVGAKGAKTQSRRVVPIQPNLLEWLKPHAKPSGKVSPCASGQALSKGLNHVAHRAGLAWVANGLRHSFCSYRLAVTHDAARTAVEAGNSAGMLARHYKALVTEADGKVWFEIRPPAGQGASIIPMPVTRLAK